MADMVANIAKGRIVELYRRVDIGDPANARLYVSVFSGTVADDTLRDCDTVAAMVTAGLTELITNGWTLKELTSTSTDTFTTYLDDTNNWFDLDIPDQTWTSVTSGTATRLVVSWSDSTPPATTAQRIPLTIHDFAVTPDGSDVQAVINTEGFYRAS